MPTSSWACEVSESLKPACPRGRGHGTQGENSRLTYRLSHRTVALDMSQPRPKTSADRDRGAASPSQRFVAPFMAYLRSECHLAVNTTTAYRRDLARFFQWLRSRNVAALGIREL